MPRAANSSLRKQGWLSSWLLISLTFGPSWLEGQSGPKKQDLHEAPVFSRQAINRKEVVRLASYRGKVVLLNFWASWCAPCLLEMQSFKEWQKDYGAQKFQVIGVSMDDALPEAAAIVSQLKIDYPVLMGDEILGAKYGGILGLPVTFLVDRKGRIRARYGASDLKSIKNEVEELLK